MEETFQQKKEDDPEGESVRGEPVRGDSVEEPTQGGSTIHMRPDQRAAMEGIRRESKEQEDGITRETRNTGEASGFELSRGQSSESAKQPEEDVDGDGMNAVEGRKAKVMPSPNDAVEKITR